MEKFKALVLFYSNCLRVFVHFKVSRKKSNNSLNIFIIYNYYAFQLNFAQLIYIF